MATTRKPVLLYACEGIDPADWLPRIQAAAPDIELRAWPDAGDPAEVDFGFGWRNPPGFWGRFPALKAIFSLGAGVEGLLADPALPPQATVVRMVDDGLAQGMSEFVMMRTLHHHRGFHLYEAQQRAQIWRPIRPPLNHERVVGVMGLGGMGGRCAVDLAQAGFQVRGWSRTAREIEGVRTFHGEAGLAAFADGCEILVCLLPLTPQTEGVLNAALFDRLAKGACLISAGRGGQMVDQDVLDALADGRLAAATLDVFRTEPLPPGHPFWTHPAVTIIPHAASFTYPEYVAESLAANVRRAIAGEPLVGVVDRATGY